MIIVWDEPKRRANILNRQMDFADLTLEFFTAAAITPSRGNRLQAIGDFHGRLVTVIFRRLGSEAISVISMRRSSRKERKSHV